MGTYYQQSSLNPMKTEVLIMIRLPIFLSSLLAVTFLTNFAHSVESTATFAKHSATVGHRSITSGRKFTSIVS